MNRYEELMDQRDYYQGEALRMKADETKSKVFKLLADDCERRAKELTIEEAMRWKRRRS